MVIVDPGIEIIDELDVLKRLELCGRVCYKSEDRITADSAERFVRAIIQRGHTSVLEHAQITIPLSYWAELIHNSSSSNHADVDIQRRTDSIMRTRTDPEEQTATLNVRDFVLIGGSVEFLKATQHTADGFITVRFICDRGVSHELVRHRTLSFSQESTRYCNYGGHDVKFIRPVPFGWANNPDSAEYKAWEAGCMGSETAYHNMINSKVSAQEARSVLNNSVKTEILVSGKTIWWREFLKLRTASDAHPQMKYLADMLNDKVKLV